MAIKSPQSTTVILGAGAIACLWASHLAQQGQPVQLLGRQPAGHRTVALSYQPLYSDKTDKPAQYRTHYCAATDYVPDQGGIASLVIATKSQDAVAALTAVNDRLAPACEVLTLCNGYGFQQEIAAMLGDRPDCTLWSGISSDGALLDAPFTVKHTGRGETAIGCYSKPINSQASLPGFLHSEGGLLNILPCENIRLRIVQKFLINCAINPLTALHECSNGNLVSDTAVNRSFRALCNELQAVCDALPEMQGQFFDVYEASSSVAQTTARNQSSMLRDRQQGRPLELRYLNRQLLNLAAKLGIDVPLNRQLVDLLS